MTLKSTQPCSTQEQLLAFLRGQESAREEADVQLHLNECDRCRERLEATAAEENVWNEVKMLFGENAPISSVAHESHDEEETNQHSWRLQQVLKDLRPTDEPDSLGRIGNYEIVGVVGTGGMGVVLKAHDPSLDRIVAIKVMAPHLASNGSARKRFAREAKAAAAVLHPNVIAIHSVASENDPPYLVMPYVRGSSLQKRIDSEGPLPLREALRIGAQVAAGLAAAHDQGLVHRDIKPANILLEEGIERVTITDFGLARTIDDASMTCSGVIAGTPQYMSPEQTRGESLDARSDLFSLGSVLYAICTGRPPFRAETTYGVLHRIANDDPRPVCEVNSDIPLWCSLIIERLIAKQANDRFASAAQVADLLEGCLAHVQQPDVMPLPAIATPLSMTKTASQLTAPQVPAPRLWASRFGVGRGYVTLAIMFFSFFLSGVFVVVETGKGTLTIESEVDDVPIRILRGESIVDRLMVTKSGTSVRVAAGDYVIELDDPANEMIVDKQSVTLKRGDSEHVRIRYSTTNDSKPTDTLETFRFDTPESLMEYVAERQNKNDVAGLLSCWTDKPVKNIAASYLLMSTMQLADFEKNPTANRPDRYSEQMNALKQILKEEIHYNSAGSLALALGVAHAEIADKNEGDFEATVEASTLSPHMQLLARATADQLRDPRSFVVKISRLHDEFLDAEAQNEKKVFHYRLIQNGDEAIATEMKSGGRSALTRTKFGWRISDPFGREGTSNDVQSLERTVDRVNRKTWEARQTLFSPPIEDLTVSQLKKAILDAAAQYRKVGKSEIALALEKSEKSNRWTNGLEFSDMITSRHDGFLQIRANLHLRSGGPALQWVSLSGIELRHSRDGWSSKRWGDIHPPITGRWELISVQKNGETLNHESFQEWTSTNPSWRTLAIDSNTLTMPHDHDRVFDFSIEYGTRPLPRFTMRFEGVPQYSGVFMSTGFVDDKELSIAVDTEGKTSPENWDTQTGNSTNLTYRRVLEP